MPHLILADEIDVVRLATSFEPRVYRWGRAVLKTADCWVRRDHQALLIEGVVVELSRPQHPLVMASVSPGSTSVRLWARSEVERTPAVQRLLAVVAADLQRRGAGPLTTTNLPDELWLDVGLRLASDRA